MKRFTQAMTGWRPGAAFAFPPVTRLYAGEAGVGERSGEERLPALRFGDVEPHPHRSGVRLDIKPHLQDKTRSK